MGTAITPPKGMWFYDTSPVAEARGQIAEVNPASLQSVLRSGVSMYFELVGEIREVETIAYGRAIRERKRLWKFYGQGRWRKKKGVATVRLSDATICKAEVHWYEAHGIGRKDLKIKRILD